MPGRMLARRPRDHADRAARRFRSRRAPRPRARGERDATVIDFVAATARAPSHRGVLLDLGDARCARGCTAHASPPDLEVREHEGASWVGVRVALARSLVRLADRAKAEAGIVVEARARGGAAKSASVYLNGKPIGTLRSPRARPIVSARATSAIARTRRERAPASLQRRAARARRHSSPRSTGSASVRRRRRALLGADAHRRVTTVSIAGTRVARSRSVRRARCAARLRPERRACSRASSA